MAEIATFVGLVENQSCRIDSLRPAVIEMNGVDAFATVNDALRSGGRRDRYIDSPSRARRIPNDYLRGRIAQNRRCVRAEIDRLSRPRGLFP